MLYKRLYTVLNNNNNIYNLQLGFRKQYSTSHALVNAFQLMQEHRKLFDDENISCVIFVNLQKAFDTVDYQILLAELNRYGIRGYSNNYFKTYLWKIPQYVFIN